MADPTPNGNIPEGLSSRPLGVLRPLGGLGFRLQRYVPLGARPLSVTRAEPMRISRSERFLPASTFESPDVSNLVQPPLIDTDSLDNSAEAVPESIQRQADVTSLAEPLQAGDIPPLPPSQAIQRQSDRVSPPRTEPLRAGDIIPPSPKTAALQRQTDPSISPASEPFKAGDIIPPSPKTAALQRQADVGAQPAAEPSKASNSPPSPPKSAPIQRQSEEPRVTPDISRPPAPAPSASPSPTPASSQNSSGSAGAAVQRVPLADPTLASAEDTPQPDKSPSINTSGEAPVNLPETPSIQRDVTDEAASPTAFGSASDVAASASSTSPVAVPLSIDVSEAAPIVDAATPNVQRRESPEPAAQGSEPHSATAPPVPPTTSPIDAQSSPPSSETVVQAKGLDHSALEHPSELEGDLPSENATSETISPPTPVVDGGSVQRQATELVVATDASSFEDTSSTFSDGDTAPRVIPEVAAGERPNVQRQPTTSTAEGAEAVSIAADPDPVISRSSDSTSQRLPDATPNEPVVETTSPSLSGDPENSGEVDAIAPHESATIQRRAAGIETPATQASEGLGGASELQRSPFTEAPPALETGAEVTPAFSSNTPVLEGETPNINRVAKPLQASSAPPSFGTTPIADSLTTVNDTSSINRIVETTDAPATSAPTDSTFATGSTLPVANVESTGNDTSTISRAAETADVSTEVMAGTEAAPITDIPTVDVDDDTSSINPAAETVDTPATSAPDGEVVPSISETQTGGEMPTINRFAETADLPTGTAPTAGVIPDADIQSSRNDRPANRAAETTEASIAASSEVEAAPPAVESQAASDDPSTINRLAETAPGTSPSEATQAADIQAGNDDTSSSAEVLETPPSSVQPVASTGSDLVQRRVTPDTQDAAPITSQPIPTVEPLEEAVPVEAGTADPASPEISRAPADASSASQDIDLPKLSTVLKPLSVIQPFRPPNARMTVTNPESLAMLPSAPAEPPKTVPPIPPPPAQAPSSSGSIQRRAETAAASVGDSEVSDTDASDDYSQQFPAMPSPDDVMAALAGRSSSQSPMVQRQPASRSGDTLASSKAASKETTSSSVDKSPQVQRKATAQPPPTEWSDVESLFNTSKSQPTSGSTAAMPPTSTGSEPYSNLKPFETIQRRATQASDTIQREESEAATITTSPNEPVGETASPEALDQLVHQVYALICQRLAVERERYGLSRRR